MSWDLSNDRPIYAQILERIEVDIVSGHYQSGGKLPSVRDLAAEAGVNPNTMQKALTELERTGLIYAQRTNGRFITEDECMIDQAKKNLAVEKVREFILGMKKLGYTEKEVADLVKNTIKEDAS